MRFSSSKSKQYETTNYEGEVAYKVDDKIELYKHVCTSILCDKYYRNAIKELNEIEELVIKLPSSYICKLAIYAREKMNLRTIPIVLLALLIKKGERNYYVRAALEKIIKRPDEIIEFLGFYTLEYADENKRLKHIPSIVKKVLGKTFNKFNKYQLGKYARTKGEISLKDAMCVLHPKPINEEKEIIFKELYNGTLEPPYTWEVEFTKLGTKEYESKEDKIKAFREKWEELIDSNKLGYMATLRNLRNFVKYEVSEEHIKKVGEFLSDPERIKESKQFPFRFVSAMLMLYDYNVENDVQSFYIDYLISKLNKCVELSLKNIEFLNDTASAIIVDVSGSMFTPISSRSSIDYVDIGLTLGISAMLNKVKSNDKIVKDDVFYIFDTKCKKIKVFSDDDFFSIFNKIKKHSGGATYGHLPINALIRENKKVDNILIFTDFQMYSESGFYSGESQEFLKALKEYRKKVNPNVKVYVFDLAGYNHSGFKIVDKSGNYLISGWNEQIFEMMKNLENPTDIINRIEEIKI